jgi:hypothetical protein
MCKSTIVEIRIGNQRLVVFHWATDW